MSQETLFRFSLARSSTQCFVYVRCRIYQPVINGPTLAIRLYKLLVS